MTNYIPITTPTIKVNRCNKGTYCHQKQNYCSASQRTYYSKPKTKTKQQQQNKNNKNDLHVNQRRREDFLS